MDTTVFDYLRWRGDLSFEADGVNEVDCAVFSALAYLDFSGAAKDVTLVDAQETVKENLPEDCSQAQLRRYELLLQAAAAPRFRNVKLRDYRAQSDEQTQFAAICFMLPQSLVLAFRGTDNTLVGWKEDFRMSYESVIPAQLQAAQYAAGLYAAIPELPVVLTGHSKGGNLAVWAASELPDKSRLQAVYSNDGPGFRADFLKSEGYLTIRDKIVKLLPQSSIVGTLLENEADVHLIRSNRQAVAQHDLLSWEVEGKQFCRQEDRSGFGKRSDAAIGAWLDGMDEDERRELTQTLFEVLQSPEKETLRSICSTAFLSNLATMYRTYSDMDKERQQLLKTALRQLVAQARQKALRRRRREEAQSAEDYVAERS